MGGLSTSYFLEKQAVVIDFGHAYTKVGFATESRPRHILPTPELRARRRLGRSASATASEEEWTDILDRLLSKVFFHYLSVSPKDRRVVVCDDPYSPAQFRRALVFVLFKRLGVPSVSLAADLVLPLYLTGLSSGIVVDCGYESTRVMSTFAGVPVLSAFAAAASGARRIHARLRRGLLRSGLPGAAADWLADGAAVEDAVVRACYVACELPDPAGGPATVLRSERAMPFTPPHGEAVEIPADCRWRPCEVLFAAEGEDQGSEAGDEDEASGDGALDCVSVPEAFVRALEGCPLDVRAAVVQNVVVCGGCAALRGLLPRLAMELRAALLAHPRMSALAERLLFTPLDFAPVCAVWTGGAVYAALEGVGDYTKESYEKGKPLPDWARDGFV